MTDLTHTSATVTVEALASNKGQSFKNPNDVDFIVKYPEGYKGNKIMPEGKVIVSKEAAEKFISLGIGSVSVEDKPADESETTTVEDKPAKRTKQKS